jgi:tRNA threonylcarbamoyladenosine biosynthesis protein TsaB
MIFALEAASPITRMWFIEGDNIPEPIIWESGRNLADELLGRIISELKQRGTKLSDVTGIIIFSGPGSFTSLRISHTVVNTLADSLHIPVIGQKGDDWLAQGLKLLSDTKIGTPALPFYGAEANITKPRSK